MTLTREQILAMEPRRELDALIAEKVMGFKCEIDKGRQVVQWSAMGAYGEWHTPPMAWKKWSYNVPPYSTDISAAFEAEEIAIEKDPAMYVHALASVVFGCSQVQDISDIRKMCMLIHATPEQRCKAAMLVVMGGEEVPDG